MAHPEPSASAVSFVEMIFGPSFPDGASVLLFETGQRTRTYQLQHPAEVDEYVAASNENSTNLYVATAFQAANVRPMGGRRNTAQSAIGIPALWLDIDVKEGAARDFDHVLEVANLIQAPTCVVESGGGGG